MASKTYDCFLTHNWSEDETGRSNHEAVSKINKALKKRGLKTWFDDEKLEGDIMNDITEGIDNSAVVVVFVTNDYIKKVKGSGLADYCKMEFVYSVQRKLAKVVAVPMEKTLLSPSAWTGPVGLALGGKLYKAQFAFDFSREKSKFKKEIDALYQEIQTLLKERSLSEVESLENPTPLPPGKAKADTKRVGGGGKRNLLLRPSKAPKAKGKKGTKRKMVLKSVHGRTQLKIVIMGDSEVGKKTMAETYSNGTQLSHEHAGTYLNSCMVPVKVNKTRCLLSLFHMSGAEHFDLLRPIMYSDTHVFVVCFALDSQRSFEMAQTLWLAEARANSPNALIFLVGTKLDLKTTGTEAEQENLVSEDDLNAAANRLQCDFAGLCDARRFESVSPIIHRAIRLIFEA